MKRWKMWLACCVLVLAAMPTGAGEVRVSFVCRAMNSEFWQSVRAGALKAAAENSNIVLTVMAPDAETAVQQQVQIVEDELVKGVDVLVIAPCGEEELTPVMQKAHEQGVPVVVMDADTSWPDKVAFVGTNNVVGGNMAGDFIADRLNGRGKVAIITGIIGHSPAMNRTAGAQEAFAKYPGIEVVAVQPANWERALGMTVAENLLSTHPELDAIFCCSDAMALGALEAVQAERSDALVVGFDAVPEACARVKDGRMAGTVAQNSFNIGKIGVQTAYRAALGETVPAHIDTGTLLVSAETVDEFLQ
ncbi:MAG: sugar ABC transporter substrate-binding protein [Planctomycetaceae bacterium]|nr:sugar ABC transporter substrate-binding protein [Planctomycetaceae bacterium]